MRLRVVVLIWIVAALAVAATSAAASQPLKTALVDPGPMATEVLAFDRMRAAGATAVRLSVSWNSIALSDAKPSNAADPANEAYQWTSLDKQIHVAHQRGLDPILFIVDAPAWALLAPRAGAAKTLPDPVELGKFTLAVARRYSGRFEKLPRVRYWQVWNEPNISDFFTPQFLDGQPFSPDWYRTMVNEVAAAVKSVHADNLVVAGGTSPFRDINPEVQKVNPRWGPLTFMRELLCLTKSLKPKCSRKVRFDVWAHHPYTSGGPTHHALLPDDVSLGDLPEMRRVLEAGVRAGNVASRRPIKFWVTEFSWDSKGPDPNGVPMTLHARWVAEALYRMWRSGVSLVTWFLLRDQPLATSFFQSGLYHRGSTMERDRPKPALRAFRFPTVAIAGAGGVAVWGRTPAGVPGRVIVERSFRGGWKRLALLKTDRYGIFQRRFTIPIAGAVRARLATTGEKSVPFGVKPVPDRFFNPFGMTKLFEPKRP